MGGLVRLHHGVVLGCICLRQTGRHKETPAWEDRGVEVSSGGSFEPMLLFGRLTTVRADNGRPGEVIHRKGTGAVRADNQPTGAWCAGGFGDAVSHG